MFKLISGGPSSFFSLGGNNVVLCFRLLISVVALSVGAFLRRRGSPDTPRMHFAPSPVYLSVRKSKGSAEAEKISLRDFMESKMPSLHLPFVPAWWLFK
jgi:hypothetical protein